jgi:hypothetical protein
VLRVFLTYIILNILLLNYSYSQTPKDILSIISRIITIGQWVDKKIANNKSIKVYYIKIETTAPSFDQAKDAGFKLAIQEALGTFVLNEEVIQFKELIRQDLILYSAGYVQDFKILEEKRNQTSVTLLMDVWVSESKIASRLLNTSTTDGAIDGKKISAQLSTIKKDREDGDKLLQLVLNDFPEKSFELTLGKPTFQIVAKRARVEVPFQMRWSEKYLDALKEVFTLVREGNDSRVVWVSRSEKSHWGSIININSGKFSNFYASFYSSKILQVISEYFGSDYVIKLSIRDDFDNEIASSCFDFQDHSTNYEKFYNKFYAYNSDVADFQIFSSYVLDKNLSFLLSANNLENTSKISKATAFLTPRIYCKVH